jgi:hypothetical protein
MDAGLIVAIVALVLAIAGIIIDFKHMKGIDQANEDLARLHADIGTSVAKLQDLGEQTQKTIDELKDMHVETKQVASELTVLREQTHTTISELKDMHTETKQLAAELGVIQKAISTKYLGPFPQFLGQIIRVINNSHDKMTISCDFPGYAKFSAPEPAAEYLEALDKALQRNPLITIDVLCLEPTARTIHRNKQFSPGWIAIQKNRNDASNYLTRVKASDPGNPTLESFTTALNEADEAVLRRPSFKAAQPRVSDHMPIYFWIGENEAVFSIPTFSQSDEHGFYTSDPLLIVGLLEMHERYRTEMTPSKPGSQQLVDS